MTQALVSSSWSYHCRPRCWCSCSCCCWTVTKVAWKALFWFDTPFALVFHAAMMMMTTTVIIIQRMTGFQSRRHNTLVLYSPLLMLHCTIPRVCPLPPYYSASPCSVLQTYTKRWARLGSRNRKKTVCYCQARLFTSNTTAWVWWSIMAKLTAAWWLTFWPCG